MKYILTTLVLLVGTAHAREPSYDQMIFNHNLDTHSNTLLVQKSLGENVHVHAAYTDYTHGAWGGRFGLGLHHYQTDNLVFHARLTYFRAEVPRGIPFDKVNQWKPMIGMKWTFDDWQLVTNVDYSQNDRIHDYFGGLVALKRFIVDRWGLGAMAIYSGYSNDWQPTLYASFEF